jgi:hypothetical protein
MTTDSRDEGEGEGELRKNSLSLIVEKSYFSKINNRSAKQMVDWMVFLGEKKKIEIFEK